MRVAAYTRVSTAARATEEKVSLDAPIKDIKAYWTARGYKIVEHYQDVGSGASTTSASIWASRTGSSCYPRSSRSCGCRGGTSSSCFTS